MAADELVECVNMSAKFLSGAVSKNVAISKAVAFCNKKDDLGDRAYFCPHFQEGLSRALAPVVEEGVDAKTFCEATEAYMFNIRSATKVPRTGSGPLLDFQASPECRIAVAAAFAPAEMLETSSVPDFWYAMCMNQDCAHFLPSRSKWCNVQHPPTHGAVVCEAVRRFALDEVVVHEAGKMTPTQICDLYAEFSKEMGIDVDAYERVLHGKTAQDSAVVRSAGCRMTRLLSGTAMWLAWIALLAGRAPPACF